MLEFRVLWVLVYSREACFLLTDLVSLDWCGLGCPLGSLHWDMWRHSLLHCIDMILRITILVSVMLCVVYVVLPWLWKQSRFPLLGRQFIWVI